MRANENGSNRNIAARRVKAREYTRDPQTIAEQHLNAIDDDACRTTRDRLLLYTLRDTGVRIGEALGLHREDLHFLPDSRHQDCQRTGAHLHVIRLLNSNGALAKSRPRAIPVTPEVVEVYVDYMLDLEERVPRSTSSFVFLNLYGAAGAQHLGQRGSPRSATRSSAR